VKGRVHADLHTSISVLCVSCLGRHRSPEPARFYLRDGQFSTRHLAETAGGVTDAYTYDAFGVELDATGATPNEFRYTGEQLDPNVGFYYLRARYYSQATGRFVTTDPERGSRFDPPSLHRYLYAHADPVDNSDPSGRFTFTIGAQIAAAFAVALLASIVVYNVSLARGRASLGAYPAYVPFEQRMLSSSAEEELIRKEAFTNALITFFVTFGAVAFFIEIGVFGATSGALLFQETLGVFGAIGTAGRAFVTAVLEFFRRNPEAAQKVIDGAEEGADAVM